MNILITGCNGQLGNEMQLLQQANSQHTFFNTDVADLDITDAKAISAFVNEHEIDGLTGDIDPDINIEESEHVVITGIYDRSDKDNTIFLDD